MNSETDIVDRLGSSIPEERREALESLDSLDPGRVLDLLVVALGDDRWRIRKTAVEALENYPDSNVVIDLVITLLGEKSDTHRKNAAIELLGRFGKKSVPALLNALKGQDAKARKLSADILGQAADPSAQQALILALGDPDENVRLAAAEALGNYKNNKSYDALLELLNGQDLTLKFCAMESLAQIGKDIPIKVIKPLTEQKILRRAAFDVLGSSSKVEAINILVSGLGDSSNSSRNAAIRSLGRILSNQPSAEKAIKKELEKPALENGITSGLMEALDANNPEVQKGAIKLLSLVNHTPGIPKIIEAARQEATGAEAIEAVKRFAENNLDQVIKNMPPPSDPLAGILKSALSPTQIAEFKAKEEPFIPETTDMTDEQFERFREYLHNFCGIYFKDEMKFILEKRLVRRIETLRIPTFEQYMDLVMNDSAGKEEIGEAINILTTNETYFFREKFQLKAFSEEVLPQIHEKFKNKSLRQLRVFSAGCSSGEEPYTLAMLIDETGLFRNWDVKIYGADISERVLEQAREGIYRKGAFRSIPDEYIKRYFQKNRGESWKIKDDLRKFVEFSKINLFERAEVETVGPFDIIFCRNVIIYFDIFSKKKVVEILHDSLIPGGYLLLGHSESLVNISTRFDLVHLKNDMIYRRPLKSGGSRQ